MIDTCEACRSTSSVGEHAAFRHLLDRVRASSAFLEAREHYGLSVEKPPAPMIFADIPGLEAGPPITTELVHAFPLHREQRAAHEDGKTTVLLPGERAAGVGRVASQGSTPGRMAAGERRAALRIGVPLEVYQAKRREGFKWCGGHQAWHPLEDFPLDASRGDGRAHACTEMRNRRQRELHRDRPPRAHAPYVRITRETCGLCQRLGERAPCKRHGGVGYSTSWSARRERREKGVTS